MGFEVYEGSAMEVSSMSFLCNYVMTSVGTYHQRSQENSASTKNEHENGQNRTFLHNNRMTCPEDKTDTRTYYQRRARIDIVGYVRTIIDIKNS